MCPACEMLSKLPKRFEPHVRMVGEGTETGHLEGAGPLSIERYLCYRCGTSMQRDGYGGRRRGWRATAASGAHAPAHETPMRRTPARR